MSKTVLITGTSRGLGLNLAREYAADGWRVIAGCRMPNADLDELVASHSQVSLHQLDVTQPGDIDKLSKELGDAPIDVLLNNAGTYGKHGFADGGIEHQAFGDTDFANFEQVLRVNLLGPMRVSEAFVDNVAASEEKKIITLSSMLGCMGLNTIGGMYAYRSSKAAVNMLMHSMGIDLAKRGILALAIHPGWARTDMGGPDADIDVATSVTGIRKVIAELTEDQLGRVIGYDGSELPY